MRPISRFVPVLFILVGVSACTSSQKKSHEPELAAVYGKSVALTELKTESFSHQKLVRSSLIDQLVNRGTFVLVSKYAVEEAREALGVAANLKQVAQKAGGEYMLRIELLKLVPTQAEETSQEKVKEGRAELKLEFTNLSQGGIFSDLAQSRDQIRENESVKDFQYRLLRQAFQEFFERFILRVRSAPAAP
jgi:hypothetical protein